VLIPALSLAEQDRHRNELDEEKQNFIYQSTREIIEELADTAPAQSAEGASENSSGSFRREFDETGGLEVLCIPARDDADDVVAMLLAQLLERQGHRAQGLAIGTIAEMVAQVAELDPAVVCISALPPFAMNHARALYAKLRAQLPDLNIAVCLWHFEGDAEKAAIRLKLSKGHEVFTTLSQILKHIALQPEKIVSHVGHL